MITVAITTINGTLAARCFVTGPDGEFQVDVGRLSSLPYEDRQYVFDENPKFWLVRNAERHADLIPEIKHAVADYKAQLRFDI